MDLSVMFFASTDDGYDVLLDAGRRADELGFSAVWTPERHFQRFGSPFPNPALTAVALAMVTRHVQLRAGSAIAPLHHPVRLAEDWAVVDRLSGGRAAVSLGSGWNRRDFVLATGSYDERTETTFAHLDTLRRLWRGDEVTLPVGDDPMTVRLHPRPVQPDLPVWITSSGRVETMARAGTVGANLLTHLVFSDPDALAGGIAAYRAARQAAGHVGPGVVTVMLHTFVANTDADGERIAGPALADYLDDAVRLEREAAAAGGLISGSLRLPAESIDADLLADLAEITAERYIDGPSLIGSIATCRSRLAELAAIGVDEVACLVDFGIPAPELLAGLDRAAALLPA